MRALTRGEAMAHYSRGQHYYVKSDWYVWFFGNPTRYSIFHTFLWKYGNGEMVSYTDLTQTEKIGSVKLKIDSIKSTIREGLALGFIDAYKAENDRRVTMYSFNEKIKFIHGKSYLLPGNIKLIACYHPSPRNVNTKLVSERMIVDLFKKARKISIN